MYLLFLKYKLELLELKIFLNRKTDVTLLID